MDPINSPAFVPITGEQLLLFLATLFTGLMAGLFYAWSVSVIPGLRRLPDRAYIEAMQALNKAILNPFFFVIFLGTAILLPICSALHLWGADRLSSGWVYAATAVYWVGCMGVTGLGNVPLNNRLEACSLTDASEADLQQARKTFEKPWNRLNLLRTISSMLAFLLLLVGAMLCFL